MLGLGLSRRRRRHAHPTLAAIELTLDEISQAPAAQTVRIAVNHFYYLSIDNSECKIDNAKLRGSSFTYLLAAYPFG